LECYLKELENSFFIEKIKNSKGYIKNELIDQNETDLLLKHLHLAEISDLPMISISKSIGKKNILFLIPKKALEVWNI